MRGLASRLLNGHSANENKKCGVLGGYYDMTVRVVKRKRNFVIGRKN